MRRLKTIALNVVAVLAMIAVPVTFVSASQGNPQGDAPVQDSIGAPVLPCKRLSAANSAGQDIHLSTSEPRTYTGIAWKGVECASTAFRLKYNERAVVIADFTAESDCNGTIDGQWCQTRAMLSGTGLSNTEGAPIAAEPSSFAFDSVTGGALNWQAHTMNRGWEIRCVSRDGCQYKFAVQTRMHDTSVTGLWLDEVAAHLRITYGAPAAI
jgi:hypothetical protein